MIGWGKMTPDDWKKAKENKLGSDDVPGGDYVVQLKGFRHFEPAKSKKGIGAYIVTSFTTAEGNAPEWVGKKLEFSFNYHPNPTENKYEQMNAINATEAVQLIEACRMDPMTDGEGMFDIPATLRALVTVEPTIVVTVTKKVEDGVARQNLVNPRPVE